MLKTILIIVIVLGIVIAGLLRLRTSGREGMPDAATLERATKRAREQDEVDEQEKGRDA